MNRVFQKNVANHFHVSHAIATGFLYWDCCHVFVHQEGDQIDCASSSAGLAIERLLVEAFLGHRTKSQKLGVSTRLQLHLESIHWKTLCLILVSSNFRAWL